MYTISDKDRVVPLDKVPLHSPGAPMPLILANDVRLVLGYEAAPDGADLILVRFLAPRAHYFGAPNDESLSGHPLYGRGLRPYGIFEVVSSSWIDGLERSNRVHPRHRPSSYDDLRHFVFTFHDDTFECISKDIADVTRVPNTGDMKVFFSKAYECLYGE
jgi:hypothetical protein